MMTKQLRRVVILTPTLFFAVVLLLRNWLIEFRSSWVIDVVLYVIIVISTITFTNWVFSIINQREAEIRTRTQQLRGLHDAALALTTELDLATVLQRVVDQARQLVNARYGALGVLNAEATYIDQFITSGLPEEQRATMGLPPRGHGVLGAILRGGETLRLENIRSDHRSVGWPPNHPQMTTFIGVPIRSKGATIGNLYLVDKHSESGAPVPFTQNDQDILEMFATQAAIAIENARLYRQTQQLIILQERERFGMNLHDGIIQSIYAIGLMLEDAMHRLRKEPDASYNSIDSSITGLNDVIRDIRNYILDLRPQRFQGRNLQEGVEELARDLRANSFLEIQVRMDDFESEVISPESTVEILHIAQEALTNIRKHARATRVEIRLESRPEDLVVCVQDNGVGIRDLDRDGYSGNGLRNMRDRARNLGGQLEAVAAEPAGTMVRLSVPRSRL